MDKLTKIGTTFSKKKKVFLRKIKPFILPLMDVTAFLMIFSLYLYKVFPEPIPYYTPDQRANFMQVMQGHDLSNILFAGETIDMPTLWSNAKFHITSDGGYAVSFKGYRPLWTDPRMIDIAIDNTLTYSEIGKLYRRAFKVSPVKNSRIPHEIASILFWVSWNLVSVYTYLTGNISIQSFAFDYPLLATIFIILIVSLFHSFIPEKEEIA